MNDIKYLITGIFLCLVVTFAFFCGSPARAGFGISPVYIKNYHLIPGNSYEQKLNILRNDVAEKQFASIMIKSEEIGPWITVNGGKAVELPAGEESVTARMMINVPADAKPGDYSGRIYIFLSADSEAAGNSINLGAAITYEFRVASADQDGKILLQVEQNGEAWYVNPADHKRYYLGGPAGALAIMQKLGLGAAHEFISSHSIFPQRIWGRILIDVGDKGKAYYISPLDGRAYYLGRPQDAFNVMSGQGVGATDHDIEEIEIGGDL